MIQSLLFSRISTHLLSSTGGWYNWCSFDERFRRLERKFERKNRLLSILERWSDTGSGRQGNQETGAEHEESTSINCWWAADSHWTERVHICLCLEWVNTWRKTIELRGILIKFLVQLQLRGLGIVQRTWTDGSQLLGNLQRRTSCQTACRRSIVTCYRF